MLKGRTISSLLHTFLRNITFTICFLLNLSLFLLTLLIIINIFFLFIIYEKFDIGPFKMRLVNLVVHKKKIFRGVPFEKRLVIVVINKKIYHWFLKMRLSYKNETCHYKSFPKWALDHKDGNI